LIRLASVLALALLSRPLSALEPITLFDIPTHGADSWDICAGPDGNLWFIEPGGQSVGRITPAGVITEFPSGPGIYAIAAGPDGNIWLGPAGSLVKMSTAGAILGSYPIAAGEGVVSKIVAGPDGAMWFALGGEAKVGRSTLDGHMSFYDVPRAMSPVQPIGPTSIAVGPDGNLWYANYQNGSVGRITTAGVVTDFPIANATPYSITAGPDGALWFTGSPQGIGRITTSGQVSGYSAAAGYLDSITKGPEGNLWFTEIQPDQVGRLTPTGTFAYAPIPVTPVAGAARGARAIVAGPDGNLWFVMRGEDKVGRVKPAAVVVGGGLCQPDDHTLCLNQGRFEVTAFFSSPTGPSQQAHAISMTENTGYFWFFDPTNVEVVVKVLNGCVAPFTSYWVFAAGLTDVRVDISVTDLRNQVTQMYSNAAGNPFAPIQDTGAFSTCP
jgi:virginiamycin B lyase